MRQEVRRRALVSVPFRLPADSAPLIRPLSIVHRRKRRLNPAVTEFIKLLCAEEESTQTVKRTPAEPGTRLGRALADRPRSRRESTASAP